MRYLVIKTRKMLILTSGIGLGFAFAGIYEMNSKIGMGLIIATCGFCIVMWASDE